MEQNDVDGSDGIFLLLVNFSDHNFVRGADGYRSLKEYKKHLVSLIGIFQDLNFDKILCLNVLHTFC